MSAQRAKIGLLTLFFDLYLNGLEALLDTCTQFAGELTGSFSAQADVVNPGVCVNREMVDAAVARFEAEDVDLIVVVFLTYTPSMYALPALRKTRLPILLFCTQKMPAVTAEITAADTDENHGVHGYQDLANVLRRAGRPYHFMSGYWQDAPVQEELAEWLQAARVRRLLHGARIGLVGYPMENMGDFGLDESDLEAQLGVHIRHLAMSPIAQLARTAPGVEIQAQMDQDRAQFAFDAMVTSEQHEAASRLEWALRKTMQQENLAGFASHFIAISEEGLFDTMPFLAASKLLGEGYSFGGEGDVTSAVAVTIMQQMAGMANFTEIFTIDFGGNTVLMSHMGEGNWKMARTDAPVRLTSAPFDLTPVRTDPVSPVFTLGPGSATLLNITTGPGRKIQWIVAEGEVVDCPPLPKLGLIHYRFKPQLPVNDFLTRYGLLGGSHHQSLAYGSWKGPLRKLAALLGVDYEEI